MSNIRILAVAVLCLVGLTAGQCENGQATFSMQRVPQYYRDCVNKVVVLPTGDITRAQAVELLAKIRVSELRLSKCGKDAIKWMDAQVDAYCAAVKQSCR